MNERGFTLIETLVACVIGTIVILTAFALMDASGALSQRVHDRVDTTQRGREGMEQITRQLRSQVCLQAGSSAVVDGQASSIVFYSFTGRGALVPDRHAIEWSSTTESIVDRTYVGTGTAPNTTYPVSPTRTRTVVSKVDPAPGTPIFAYFAWSTTGTVEPSLPLAVPLTSVDAARAVRVVVTFRVSPAGKSSSGETTTLQDEVVAHTTDPNMAGGPGLPDCG
ncbi:MAG TPA: prepilin-type N-terminal cleavage/methylation domain-containing protein [Thermoleophilaceae bacterium]|jgi:prepilin-type N-terminal cleavage/methylation domain-containing protein